MATLAVLEILMEAGPRDLVWGFRLCEEANLGSGTVYPLLERLERDGLVVSYWEDPAPSDRPRRRFYEMTTAGRKEISAAVAAKVARRRRLRPRLTQLGGA